MNTNTKKRVWTFLMALMMIFTLVACGGGGGKDPSGTYALTKMGSGDMEMTAEDLAAIAGMDVGIVLELTKDNKFTLDLGVLADMADEDISGTWKLDGDALILSANGEDLPVTYDGKTIVLDMEGESLTFEKE